MIQTENRGVISKEGPGKASDVGKDTAEMRRREGGEAGELALSCLGLLCTNQFRMGYT